jgi:hypothetical protein
MKTIRLLSVLTLATMGLSGWTPVSHATTGPGCLVVVNVASGDALNLRARPSSEAAILDVLVPGEHGVIHLDGQCQPKDVPWRSRWCPVTHYSGNDTTHGWVKARFVRDSECP